jgi:periplasmic protein TonB
MPEAYSLDEIAAVAGIDPERLARLAAAGRIRTIDGEFVAEGEARQVVRALLGGGPSLEAGAGDLQLLLPALTRRQTGVPLLVSSSLHAAAIGGVVLLTAVQLNSTAAEPRLTAADLRAVRMVYLADPGPGGGGGGGGTRLQPPPSRAERRGTGRLSSPVPARRPPMLRPAAAPLEEPGPPLAAASLPPVIAPVAALPADRRNRGGVIEDTAVQTQSQGPGRGGGAGSGAGTGLGSGEGAGLGSGSGGGTGGGPYRPGSGSEPPRLLREVKPDYTDEARRKGITGEVVLEIVVRRDGSVGDIRVLRRLEPGLDNRAIQAVRQWRFAPATRQGSPVDVAVEVAVEFRLR